MDRLKKTIGVGAGILGFLLVGPNVTSYFIAKGQYSVDQVEGKIGSAECRAAVASDGNPEANFVEDLLTFGERVAARQYLRKIEMKR